MLQVQHGWKYGVMAYLHRVNLSYLQWLDGLLHTYIAQERAEHKMGLP